MDTELTYLAASIVLAFAHILVAAQFKTAANGLGWGAGPRDAPPKPPSALGGRLDRAAANMLETFPLAVAAILIAHVAGRHNVYTSTGAALYVWARVAYWPLYAAGIPVVRSVVWLAAMAGIALVLIGLVWS